MKTRVVVIAAISLGILVQSAPAYLITPWSYQDLFAKSDFVVIAERSTAPRDTNERTTLTRVSPPLRVIGVTTEFKTLFVLKGPKLR
jgi:hypothetical protein